MGGPPPSLAALRRFEGHSATVEDVCFHPAHDTQLCSVADDSALRFWDAAAPGGCTAVVAAGEGDVHCCDWSALDEHLVVTGGADATLRVFDRRKAGGAGAASALLHSLKGHSEAVNCVQWCPDARGVLASASSDGLVNLWDLSRGGLLFQHQGHQSSPVLDMHWSPALPWTLVSCSENEEAGGGCVQAWRISDLLSRPQAEVLAELEQHRAELERAVGGWASRGGEEASESEDDD